MTAPDFAAALSLLTVQPEKAAAYRDDFVPDEAWRTLRERFGEATLEFLHGYSFILIKPEAMARRLSVRAIRFLAEKGLAPVAVTCVALSRNTAQLLWRYQWNAATVDRVELAGMVAGMSPSIFVLLKAVAPGDVPACVRLWQLKGSAHAENRSDEHLRSALRMHNRMLGFVHTPDEPADVVRELSILFGRSELQWLLDSASRACSHRHHAALAEAERSVLEAENSYPAHLVDPQEVVERIRRHPDHPLARFVPAFQRGTRLSLATLLAGLDDADEPGLRWDALTLAAELIQHDRDGVGPLLSSGTVDLCFARWTARGRVSGSAHGGTSYVTHQLG